MKFRDLARRIEAMCIVHEDYDSALVEVEEERKHLTPSQYEQLSSWIVGNYLLHTGGHPSVG